MKTGIALYKEILLRDLRGTSWLRGLRLPPSSKTVVRGGVGLYTVPLLGSVNY
jgi:hypothetical protein